MIYQDGTPSSTLKLNGYKEVHVAKECITFHENNNVKKDLAIIVNV